MSAVTGADAVALVAATLGGRSAAVTLFTAVVAALVALAVFIVLPRWRSACAASMGC